MPVIENVRFHDSPWAMDGALSGLTDQDVVRVSPDFPLRANLSALENIALIPLFRDRRPRAVATALAGELLAALGHAPIAPLRDPDLDPSGRFVVKLARAVAVGAARIVIDRPGAMLTDIAYPAFIEQCMHGLRDRVRAWEVYDFTWNRPLYPPTSIPASPDASAS